MHFGIDISQTAYTSTGVARYIHNLTNAIIDFENTHTWTFLYYSWSIPLNNKLKERIKKSKHILKEYKIPNSIISKANSSLRIPTIEQLVGKQDVFITSDWIEFKSRNTKKATIVYDMIYKLYPQFVHKSILSTQEKRMQLVKKESDLIITDSMSALSDVKKILNINENKITYIYPGVTIDSKMASSQELYKVIPLSKPYILSVGTISPRKNIERLLKAYALSTMCKTHELIIVGNKGWGDEVQIPSGVRFTGSIDDSLLMYLYTKAKGFIFPSIYEGFGIPLIEAMQYGALTACSRTSSLQELGDKYSILFDPLNVSEIQSALEKLCTMSNTQRENIITKAKVYADQFTWKKSYEQILEELLKLTV